MKVLLISPSIKLEASGNVSTIRRIQKHLISENIECMVVDSDALTSKDAVCSRQALHKFAVENYIHGIVFLHAFKCARMIFCGCAASCVDDSPMIPYGVIFGGTDLNVDIFDPDKRSSMQRLLSNARFAVAFTDALRKSAFMLVSNLKVFVQPQAVEIDCSNFSADFNDNSIDDNGSIRNIYTFIMVTGLRPVKDPLFILEAWIDWCRKCENPKLKLLIIGPVLDEMYTSIFFRHLNSLQQTFRVAGLSQHCAPPQLNGLDGIFEWLRTDDNFPILYAPPLPHDQLKTLLCSPYIFASVNTSESEGMASAVLESMVYEIPVIARDNCGNKSVIKEGQTGLLFHSPDDFINQATKLIHEPGLRDHIVKKALEMVSQHHSLDKEREFYKMICQKYFCNIAKHAE